MSNSPRYVGFTSPPYSVTFVDDTGQRIDLTGADTSLFSWRLQNLTAQTTHMGGGSWVVTDAVNGEAEYYLTLADVSVAGSCLVFVTIQLPSDSSPREFDPDPLVISVGSGSVSPAPIPLVQVSGYVAPIYLVDSAGTNKASVSSGGALKVDNSGVVQPVIGTITANAGTNLNTSLLALESGGNLAALKTDADTLVTNTTGLATQTTLAAAKTDLDSVVTNTSNTATNTSNINTHAANIDTATSASKTDLDTIVTQTSNMAKETGGHLASIDTSTAASKSDLDSILTHEASIDSHIPAQGQALMSGSLPVAIASNQSAIPASQSGTWLITANAGTNLNTSSLALESGGNLAAIKSDSDSIATNTSNTATNTSNINTHVANIDTATAASKTDLDSIVTNTSHIPTVGQKVMASSTPVTIASDQSSVPINGSVTATQTTGSNLHTVVDSGTVTANAGTNLNTSLLALESGGNLAALKSDADTLVTNTSNTATNTNNINTAIGTTADSAYAGSGTTTNIGGLKGLYAKLSNVVLAAGSALIGGVNVVDSAGTNKLSIGSSGAASVNVSQVGGSSATTMALGQAVKSSSLSVVLASDTPDIPVRGDFVTYTNLSAGSLNADLLPSTDVSQYRYMTLHIIGGTWSGTIQYQKSLDNANFQNFELTTPIPTVSQYSFQTTVNGWYEGAINALYCRIRMTSYTSGTALGVVTFYTTPPSPNNTFAYCMQGIPASSATPWYFAGANNNAVQTAGGSGTVIKGSAGHLWSAVVTASGTAELDVYDNASTGSGKILLAIPANASVGSIYNFVGGAAATNGIYSNGVANCPAVTFYYGG